MTAACLAIGGIIFVFVLILTSCFPKSYSEMTEEEREQYQQRFKQIYGSALDALEDPQYIEDKQKEKLMNDYEYFLLTGELHPTK